MRKILMLSVVLIAMTSCKAQVPPQSVTEAFNAKFATAKSVKWDEEKPGEWEAEFKMNKQAMSASYDGSGNWMETEIEIKVKALPAIVTKAISNKYTDFEIDEACKIETNDFKGFEVIIDTNEQDIELLITEEGILTVKEIIEEE